MKQYIVGKLISKVEEINKKYSLVGDEHFFDINEFSWVKKIEQSYDIILDEFQNMLDANKYIPSMSELSDGKNDLTNKDNWRVYSLVLYGKRVCENHNIFDQTYKIINKIPNIKTAFFSILPAGVKLDPHRGPYNGVLRYHLGLIIPTGDCGIRVNTDKRKWQEGTSLIFDDSYEHEAWNNTSDIRVVLFIDFIRPLPKWVQFFNIAVYKYITNNKFTQKFLDNAKIIANNGHY